MLAWTRNQFASSRIARVKCTWAFGLCLTAAVCSRGAGLDWPTNRFLPTFSTPASNIDCIDISSASGSQVDLFTSLEGIVNRTQPRIACVASSTEEGAFTWLNIHGLGYTVTSGFTILLKYKTNV